MLKLSAAAIAVTTALTVACGGSPTSPRPLDTTATAVSSPNAPAPPEPPPGPPSEPAPGPAPTPPPTPAPAPPGPAPTAPVEIWHATVDVQRAASPDKALPATFTVKVQGDRMLFGPLDVIILVRQGTHIYARKGTGLTIQIDDGKWTLTSADVFATGTLTYE